MIAAAREDAPPCVLNLAKNVGPLFLGAPYLNKKISDFTTSATDEPGSCLLRVESVSQSYKLLLLLQTGLYMYMRLVVVTCTCILLHNSKSADTELTLL